MCLAEPVNNREPNLLIGFEHEPLIFKNGEDCINNIFKSPSCGWDHALIEQVEQVYSYFGTNKHYCCYDIFLGDKWLRNCKIKMCDS